MTPVYRQIVNPTDMLTYVYVGGENGTLTERLKATKVELEEAVNQQAKLNGQLQEAKRKVMKLEEELRAHSDKVVALVRLKFVKRDRMYPQVKEMCGAYLMNCLQEHDLSWGFESERH